MSKADNLRYWHLPSIIKVVAFVLLIIGLTVSAEAAQKKRPNFLIMIADDIGYSNLGVYGGGELFGAPTPNIDKLAKEGSRFTDWYGQPSCTSGRAALFTGQLPIRTGLTAVLFNNSREGLKPEVPTIAEVLSDAGYQTALFGKWHLGDREEHLPHRQGFDKFWGFLYHMNLYEEPGDPDWPGHQDSLFRKKHSPRGVITGTKDGKTGEDGPINAKRLETIEDELVEHTTQWLEKAAKKDEPFLLVVAPYRMHVWTHVSPSRRGKSTGGEYGDAMMAHDDEMGQVLNKLDELGLKDNTVVLYTTDNGAMELYHKDRSYTPFRGYKGTTWEGGMRVPAIMRWPGKIPADTVLNGQMSHLDVLPTFAKLAGVNYKKVMGVGEKICLDGYDQSRYIQGKSKKSKRKITYFYNNDTLTAIRWGKYKAHLSTLDCWFGCAPKQYVAPLIFDLRVDPFETQNDAVRYAYVAGPLLEAMGKHIVSLIKFPPISTPANMNKPMTQLIREIKEDMKSGKLKL